MTAPFQQAFERTIGFEGGYSNDPRDPGGETKYGISKRAYPTLDIASLTLAQAKAVYHRDYWRAVRGDELPAPIAIEVFDAAVNHGPKQAIKFMQRALKVNDDGIIGPVTLGAVRRIDPAVFAARFNGERLMFYTELKTWPAFGRGWSRRVAAQLRSV